MAKTMKTPLKTGDQAKVLVGKFSGKTAQVIGVDSKAKRVRLEGLKVLEISNKKGQKKQLHGTFHLSSLQVIRPEPPKKEEPAETAQVEQKAETSKAPEAPKQKTGAEAPKKEVKKPQEQAKEKPAQNSE